MDWRERAAAVADARASVHDMFKRPALVSGDRGSTWAPVFCRVHESVNPEGQQVGQRNAQVSVDTDAPHAIFRHADVPALKTQDLVSIAPGVSYSVASLAPPDLYGYRKVRLKREVGQPERPAPDWGAF